MAIVVDEYRAVAGVVTIEDALEEIVGEIADETDPDEEIELIRTDERTLEVDGRVHIDELNEQYGLMLPEPEELVTELRLFLENVDVKATVFRSNHASNYVPLAGRLPKDKQRLLDELDSAIRQHRFKPEFMRGL